jgi:hypothetical protein
LGSSEVASQLAASGEGLSSMKLVITTAFGEVLLNEIRNKRTV